VESYNNNDDDGSRNNDVPVPCSSAENVGSNPTVGMDICLL